MKGSSPDRNLRMPNRVPKTHNRALEIGGLHRRKLSMVSIPDIQGLFFLLQTMNGSLSIYKACKNKGMRAKSRVPLIIHEKKN